MILSEKYPALISAAGSEKVRDLVSGIEVYDVDEGVPAGIDPANSILVAFDMSNAEVFSALVQSGVQHFVQTSRSDHMVELLTSALMLKSPQLFLTGEKSFLLSKVMKNAGKETRSFSSSFKDSKKKSGILANIQDFVQQSDQAKRYTQRILQIADEMIMNALYNAPINKKGEHIFSDMDRSDYVEYYTKNTSAKIHVYHDKTRLIVGCEDPWGSLEVKPLIQKINGVFAGTSTSESDGGPDGGSGLGVRLLIENSTSFYTLVVPNEKTMIYCNFEFKISNRRMETMPKHIHFHVIQ